MLLPFLHRVADRHDLSAADAQAAMLIILDGQASTPQIAAFLTALRIKGETPEELLGFAHAMREKVTRVSLDLNGAPLLDTCGTGGGGPATFNISTIAAFVLAGAGVYIAKHGNRSNSTPCGSAEILETLGINVMLSPATAAAAIHRVGIAFLFAPMFHPAMKHVAPARAEIKMRTVFNLLGPLTNPAGAQRQLIGAPSVAAAELMANALVHMRPEKVFLVHGSDGLDEITTTGTTTVFEVAGNSIRRFEWTPHDFGVRPASLGQLLGGAPTVNCKIATDVLQGKPGPQRDIVLVNAAAGLMAAGICDDPRSAMDRCAHSIDSGAAWEKVQRLAEFTKQESDRPAHSSR